MQDSKRAKVLRSWMKNSPESHCFIGKARIVQIGKRRFCFGEAAPDERKKESCDLGFYQTQIGPGLEWKHVP